MDMRIAGCLACLGPLACSKSVLPPCADSANGGGDADSGGETGEEGKRQRNNVMVAILNFVDLAGSERASTALMGDEQDGIR